MTDYRTQPINQKNADFVEQVADRIEEMQLEGLSLIHISEPTRH